MNALAPAPLQPTGPISPAAQGLLSLDFDTGVQLPARPNLRLVTGDEPGLDAFATRFAQAVVEVIGGDRGVYQLMRWTTDAVYDDLQRRSSVLQRTAGHDPRRPRLRAQVRSVHLSRPQPDVAEISIHVRHGQRSRAIAARIELIEGRWRCSALEFG
ncbi:MAG: Rv3235 family protein [Propionibacteriales bacterium]|nr:Rv3235 family protein [Propionibacteriales bacterium]